MKHFNRWWELNEPYCDDLPLRLVAFRAWSAVKAHHRMGGQGGSESFEQWWKVSEAYYKNQSRRLVALSAWLAVKTYHRIPLEEMEFRYAELEKRALSDDGFCSCTVFQPDPSITAIICKHCGREQG